ncbi:MAG TPA: DR2241 family protein [Candidatus Udaeobacter sp.]|jgi:sirohydrochlorin cobaltochelatase|nr:DR2241 family protein [Candidatus Udaeobacter sp.]
MSGSLGQYLEAAAATGFCIGQIVVQRSAVGFVLFHRDDYRREDLEIFGSVQDSIEIAKFDDAGNYRPLKTAPNLRHGWRLKLEIVAELSRALDYFYPGRLAMFAAWNSGRLQTTPLRVSLDRQSGMYRVAAKISDSQINDVVADFCRSEGGCLRTILWNRDRNGTIASTKLPNEKFDPAVDQVQAPARPGSAIPATVPLICQEACNLLIAECRKVVKAE